jgi:hypothetical protein
MGTVEAASAPLLRDILAVRDYAWSYARAGVITPTLITHTCPTCQLELLHSLLQGMQERSTAAGVGTGTKAEYLRRILPRVLVGGGQTAIKEAIKRLDITDRER